MKDKKLKEKGIIQSSKNTLLNKDTAKDIKNNTICEDCKK